jgi:hypothetical protein
MPTNGDVSSVHTIPWIPPDGKYAGSCAFHENWVRIKIPYLPSDRKYAGSCVFEG